MRKKMKKAKFWISQVIMVAIVSMVLGSPALADKPIEKQIADCLASGGWFIGEQCSISSTNSKGKKDNNGKGKGSGSGSDTTETGTTGDGTGDDSGYCPDGMIYLPLYGICIPV